jgi:hypothetical protein
VIPGQLRMTPRMYLAAAKAGVFEDRKVELLGGIVCETTPNPPHCGATLSLLHAFRAVAPHPSWFVIHEAPVGMGKLKYCKYTSRGIPVYWIVDLTRSLRENTLRESGPLSPRAR